MEKDEFLNDSQGYMSMRGFSDQWIPYILEYDMPNVRDAEQAKTDLVNMLKPVINTAARTNLKRQDVDLFLWGFENVWQAFFIYKRKGKYDADLLCLKRSLKEGYALMLYRSIEMRQMGMLLEPKQNIFQRFVSNAEKRVGLFKSKKTNNEIKEE